jgi:hypothetical protein
MAGMAVLVREMSSVTMITPSINKAAAKMLT